MKSFLSTNGFPQDIMLLLELLIFRGWLEAEQADALAPCGGASDFGTYHDTHSVFIYMIRERSTPHVCDVGSLLPQIIPPLDDTEACSNSYLLSPLLRTRQLHAATTTFRG